MYLSTFAVLSRMTPLTLSMSPDHKGLVTCNANVWLNVEAMQHLHDIINSVIARSELNFIDDKSSLGINDNIQKNLQWNMTSKVNGK